MRMKKMLKKNSLYFLDNYIPRYIYNKYMQYLLYIQLLFILIFIFIIFFFFHIIICIFIFICILSEQSS